MKNDIEIVELDIKKNDADINGIPGVGVACIGIGAGCVGAGLGCIGGGLICGLTC